MTTGDTSELSSAFTPIYPHPPAIFFQCHLPFPHTTRPASPYPHNQQTPACPSQILYRQHRKHSLRSTTGSTPYRTRPPAPPKKRRSTDLFYYYKVKIHNEMVRLNVASKSNLYQLTQFYKSFPLICYAVSGKSQNLLSWTHYPTLLQVDDTKAREWYTTEAFNQTWSIRTLQRNISSQYYYRMLQSHNNTAVENEMNALTDPLQKDKLEFIKNSVAAEFLGLSPNHDFTESKLESSIITHLQRLLKSCGGQGCDGVL